MATSIGGPITPFSSYFFAGCLILIAAISFFMNIIALVVFARINRLFKGYSLGPRALIISMTIADLLFILAYTVPTIIACFHPGQWLPGDVYCRVQVVLAFIFAAVSMHTLAALSVERCVKFYDPNLHEMAFTDATMAVLLVGLWIFDIVVGILPVIGWGSVLFTQYLFQCSFDYVISFTYQIFSFVVIFGLPFLVTILVQLALQCRVSKLLKQRREARPITLNSNEGQSESYLVLLVRLQTYLATVPRRKRIRGKKSDDKPGRRRRVQDPEEEGYGSNSSEDEIAVTVSQNGQQRKKIYKFRRSDVVTAHTYMWCSLIYFLTWICHIAVYFTYTTTIYLQIPTAAWLIGVFFTHTASLVKPVIYFAQNYKFRYALYYGLRPWLYKEGPIDLSDEIHEDDKGEQAPVST